MVPPALSESGFYSRYFLVPKRMRRPPAHPRSQTPESRPHETAVQDDHAKADPLADSHRGGSVSLDLKDAYFHIQIAPHHRRFLRFAFEGVAYQYTVLPLGCLWAPVLYKVHGRGSFPSETDGNLHSQLPRRLAHSAPVKGGTSFTQKYLSSSAT